jgi:hypothetical protein
MDLGTNFPAVHPAFQLNIGNVKLRAFNVCDKHVDGISFASGGATSERIGVLVSNIVDTYSVVPIPVYCVYYPTCGIFFSGFA